MQVRPSQEVAAHQYHVVMVTVALASAPLVSVTFTVPVKVPIVFGAVPLMRPELLILSEKEKPLSA